MFKKALLGSAAAMAVVGSAAAADLPSRRVAPPPVIAAAPVPVFTWTGFYAGLNAGAAVNASSNQTNNAFFGNNNSGGANVAFIGGGQIGFNYQTGPIVFGVEADAQYRSRFGGTSNNYFANQVIFNTSRDGFLGTARGRLGLGFNQFMVYATGGVAFGNRFDPIFGDTSFKAGYTVGGGIEYALTPNFSIKAEYLYVDLGRSFTSSGFANNGFFGNGGFRSNAHVARLGVNYRFNTFGGVAAAPVVARY